MAAAPQRATREQGTGDKLANSPWLPVLTAGLGTLASRSPFASVAIGQGGLEGVKTLQQQQGAQREQDKLETDKEYREAEVKNRADQLSQLAKQHTETIGQEQKRLAAEQENWQKQRELQGAQIAETGKYREALEVPPDVRSATWYAGATPEQRAAYDKMYSARRAPMAGVAGAVRWIENDPAFAGKDPMAVYQQMRQTNNPQARAQLKERYMTSQGNVQRGLSPQELGQEFETLFPAGVPAAGAAAPAGGGSKPPIGDILGN